MIDNIKEVETISGLPECANPKCKNLGIIMFGKKLYCGDCTVKITKYRETKIDREAMEALNNDS